MTGLHSPAPRLWTGDEWEAHIRLLLKHHYALGEYQDVPARDGGDYGIEGFSRDGNTYQCYCAEGILTTRQLYEKQRDKMTTDLGKFVNNHVALAALFGDLQIRRWLLVVPEFRGPAIVAHANAKRDEVVALGRSYVSPDFAVGVITDDEFAAARQQLAGVGLIQIAPAIPDVTSDVVAWGSANSSLLDALVRKVSRLPSMSDDMRERFIALMVSRYERGQLMLDHLRSQYPDIYERLLECKSARQRVLEIDCLTSGLSGGTLIERELRELRHELASALPGVSPSVIADLVGEALADWLMRCPLDFPLAS